MRSLCLASQLMLLIIACTPPLDQHSIQSNDNRRPAGTLKDGVLTLALETHIGSWQPDGEGGRALDSIVAFAEVGKSPSIPGPLIRVPIGTRVRGTVHNTLGHPLWVFGLDKNRGAQDSLHVGVDSTLSFEFTASSAGTFFYDAYSAVDSASGGPPPNEWELKGVLVVDGPNSPRDRILAITWLEAPPKDSASEGVLTMVINGRSWPHTEHLTYTQGDSVHWRVVNLSDLEHPMHLHGFYFRVDGRSDGVVDTAYTEAQQRMAVTEVIEPFHAVSLSWRADRPGNWLYHCHYANHISHDLTIDQDAKGHSDSTGYTRHPSDRPHHMAGLVMGLTVLPRGHANAPPEPAQRVRIVERETLKAFGDDPAYSYVVDGARPSTTGTVMPVPGAPLLLERGKRVQITVVNQTSTPSAVHWHGIELESYPDGVPDWSGSGKDLLRPIPVGDSLTVAWTPPRAGSFMYHPHLGELKQMQGGAYGPIIVLEPGAAYDPETDRTFFFGTEGNSYKIVLNGTRTPPPMELTAGVRYRFRFFNLAGDVQTLVALRQGDKPVQWRATAKDGYPLPADQAVVKPSRLVSDPGEIYDFEFTPERAGELNLRFGLAILENLPAEKIPKGAPPLVMVPVHVR